MCIWLYAGNSEYPALLSDVRQGVYHSDNMTGADNQQERLIEFRGWVIGFVDGEGCFSIGFVRQPDRAGRRGYTTGYQVFHLDTIIPFFHRYPLRTSKRRDFEKFARCMNLVDGDRRSDPRGSGGDRRDCADDESPQAQARCDQNPQRPYARRPGHRMMRWSHLHGDMQGRQIQGSCCPSMPKMDKARAKFLVG